jgi:hypothetical protein
MTDQIVEGGRIAAYKIQWFNGQWSGWYVPGVNDMDTKFNIYPRKCSLSYRAKSMRRRWSYFYDHTRTCMKSVCAVIRRTKAMQCL